MTQQPWVQENHPAHANVDVRPGSQPLPEPPPPARYPLHVSADRRRIVDHDGTPFLVQGDAAWSLIANLTYDEAIVYLDDRRAKGFNTLIVSVVEHLFSRQAPRDRSGNEPFTTPGDMSTPNDVYFDHAERVLEACAARGIAVILACCYIGHRHDPSPGVDATNHAEGWYYEVVGTGPEGCRAYGEYLGKRFGRFDNIIWCIGGDWDPDAARTGLDAIAAGIRSTGVSNLFTAHVRPETSGLDSFAGSDWLDINLTYSYGIVHRSMLADWARVPVTPFLLIESTYEGEHNATDLQIRRQAWWSVLCGANGQCMGNNPIWLFWDGWQAALELPASVAMARWGAFFRALPWADLVPDNGLRLVTSGLGETRGLDRVTAALTTDGRVGVAYLPVPRPMTVDLGILTGTQVRVTWFEPATGQRRSGGTLRTGEVVTLTPPFHDDSALLLESIAD
jgi:Protein of unknown function (DUF4038)/Putative collagen-binding domain of a collagenase